jgi:hypothetical protein
MYWVYHYICLFFSLGNISTSSSWNFIAFTWNTGGEVHCNINGKHKQISSNFKQGYHFDLSSRASLWTIGGKVSGANIPITDSIYICSGNSSPKREACNFVLIAQTKTIKRDWNLRPIATICIGYFGLALVSIYEIDVTSFSEDGRGVKWLCN